MGRPIISARLLKQIENILGVPQIRQMETNIYPNQGELEKQVRDLMSELVTTVWVDDVESYKKVSKFVGQLMPKYRQNIILYEEKKPLFDLYDIDLEISRAIERKVWLKSGGYIVFDEAEALVVIDNNNPANISHPKLMCDFFNGLKIGFQNGVFKIFFANKAAGVHVNHDQRFGFVNNDVST